MRLPCRTAEKRPGVVVPEGQWGCSPMAVPDRSCLGFLWTANHRSTVELFGRYGERCSVWGLQLSVRGANAKLHQKEGNNQECQGRSVDPKAKGQRSSHATTTCHKQIRSLQVSIQPSSLDVAPTFTKLTCLRVFSDSVPLLVEHITRDH